MTPIRQEFEAWFIENSSVYSSEPIGSRACHLQWKAWQAATSRQEAKIKVLTDACEEFVRKVECGEARSKSSYAQMKAALAKTKETP